VFALTLPFAATIKDMLGDTCRSSCARFSSYGARLYAGALDQSDQAYRLHIGVFFGSLHGTLNHLLLTDRIWLKRLTGESVRSDFATAVPQESCEPSVV
jgi:uncharacterized damage-inducible protein DinB